MQTLPLPDDHPDGHIVDDVAALLRKFGGDDLSQQDAIRALGMWKNNSSLTAAERAAILDRFTPDDPGQAKLVNLLGTFEQTDGGVSS